MLRPGGAGGYRTRARPICRALQRFVPPRPTLVDTAPRLSSRRSVRFVMQPRSGAERRNGKPGGLQIGRVWVLARGFRGGGKHDQPFMAV
jgi:hypothetical protein